MRRLIVEGLWPLLEHHRRLAGLLVLCGFLASMAEGIGISLFVPLVDALDPEAGTSGNGPGVIHSLAGIFSDLPADDRLTVVAAVIFALVLGKAILNYATTTLSVRLAAQISHDLRLYLSTQRLFQ